MIGPVLILTTFVAVNEQQREESKRTKRLANPVAIPGLVDGLGFERGDWRGLES
ncbi:hypothetical protein OIU84_026840 [Salix udensis]|uniref:Uncharacterized protein n=1 Tax=Salix udensis TaxID=889485 RepID=A0AAD6J6D9_9ROSI|nr:hypothetical protein OIU84_026840 [Salix udensis]